MAAFAFAVKMRLEWMKKEESISELISMQECWMWIVTTDGFF